MILKILLQILMFIIQFILGTIARLTPEFTPQTTLNELLPEFMGVMSQAKNFVYFIIGDAFFVIVDFIVTLIVFKLTAKPIIQLIRRLITRTE